MSYIKLFLISLFAFTLLSCDKPRSDDEVYLGTIAGPESKLVTVAQKIAQDKYQLKIKLFEFEDYNIPNLALNDGSIDANMFQHQPFLDIAKEYKGFDIVAIGKTFIFPMGGYSKRYQNIQELPEGATIAIPNDPSNGARALRLLAVSQLIEVPELDDMKLNPKKITHNPHNFKFMEMDAAQLPRIIHDVDLAIINTNFAVPAGLIPTRDALILEDKDSPYANIVVVRTKEKDHPKYQKLMQALHDPMVVDLANELFQGQALPAW